ncbi:uncharacterized protein VTP21DRAFT_1232 [Calcarisporiella thermophila]|uniref:uncharacterized protein n=1 Tax=Calcarisporiella thermophila TaxID=911321 RepID=UPI00374213C1
MTSSSVTPANPPYPALKGSNRQLFAFATISKRLPIILTKTIDDVYQAYHKLPPEESEKQAEAKQIIEKISRLKYELQHDKPLIPIEDDGEPDVQIWNDSLKKYFDGVGWYDSPWLFCECYMYRRIRETFSQSKHWKNYDPYFKQKIDAFRGSLLPVQELAKRFAEPPHIDNKEEEWVLFHELVQVCLWGNATDLSLLANMSAEEIKKLQSSGGRAQLAEKEKNILCNHIDRLWKHLQTLKGGRVDFILDNAGFELFVDLIFADWLIQAGYASKIQFHCKAIPWFVSDVMPVDFQWMIDNIAKFFGPEDQNLITLGQRWKSYIDQGLWYVRTDRFWTLGFAFWELVNQPALWEDLKQSQLLIFKGDLNFRKLTYDCQWPTTTPFEEAIGPLTQGPPVVVLRTNKADVCVGLPDGKEKEVEEKDKDWRYSGKYAVICFSNGNSSSQSI